MLHITQSIIRKRFLYHRLKLPLIVTCILTVFLFATSSFALTNLTIFGPMRYDRQKGAPTVYTNTFERCNPANQAILRVINGDKKETRIRSASISVNGEEIVREKDFNAQVSTIEKVFSIQNSNELKVVLKSGWQDDLNNALIKDPSFLVIEIIGIGCDSTPPVISNLQPDDDSLLNNAVPLISAQYTDGPGGSGIDVSTVQLALDGVTTTSLALVSASGISYTPSSNLPEGRHVASLTVSDRAHNAASASWSFMTDTVAPVISITSHQNNQYLNTQMITLSGVLDDPSAAVTVNGRVAQVTGNSFSVSDFALVEGQNAIIIEARDPVGNIGKHSITIHLDTAPPVVSITSPIGGFIINKTPSVIYTVSDGTVMVKVDEVVVSKTSGDSLDALPDGQHTIRVEAMDIAGNMGLAEVNFTVDTLPPAISINPVTSPTYTNSQTITGDRESGATVIVSVNTTAIVGPVSYPTPITWSCNITGLSEGTNTVTVTATDAATNRATATASITLSMVSLALSNVGISTNTINTALYESSTVFFTLNRPATTTLKIIPEKQGPSGTPVYEASQVCPTAGAYLFTWDGTDNTGKVAPDEAYLLVLSAFDGTSADTYSPPVPAGTGSVTCSQDTYNPYKNDPLAISYTVARPERVNLTINWGVSPFKVMSAVPHAPGSYTFNWDGRNTNGKILPDGARSQCSVASLLPDNHVVTIGDTPKISNLKTDPVEMHLSYGQFTRISYDLSRDADVTVKLIAPSGAEVVLIDNQRQEAGHHMVEDEITPVKLIDGSDPTGKRFVVSQEGEYIVSVRAASPVTGIGFTMRGYLRIGY